MRLVVLLVLIALPLALTGILFWFVASDSWARQLSDRLSERLQLELSLDDVAFAAADQRRLSGLVLHGRDGDTLFSSPRIDVYSDGEQWRLSSAQWQWQLHQDSMAYLRHLLRVQSARPHSLQIDLHDGTAGSLQVSLQRDAGGDALLRLNGPLDDASFTRLAEILDLADWAALLPDFIRSACTIDLLALHLAADGSCTQWSLECQWPGGALQVAGAGDGTARLIQFSDQRLPAMSITDGALHWHSLFALPVLTDIHCSFDQEQRQLELAAVHMDQSVRIALIPDRTRIVLRAETLRWQQALPFVERYLPQWLREQFAADWDLGGSSCEWRDTAVAQGNLQLRGTWNQEVLQLRGAWSLADELRLSRVLLQLPQLHVQLDMALEAKQLVCTNLQVLKIPQVCAALYRSLELQRCTITRVQQNDAECIQLRGYAADDTLAAALQWRQHGWQLSLPDVDAALLNPLLQRSLFADGQLTAVSLSGAARQRRLIAVCSNIQCAWPLAQWQVTGGQLLYSEEEQTQRWSYTDTLSTWTYTTTDQSTQGSWHIVAPLLLWDWSILIKDGNIDMRRQHERN